MLLCTFFFSLVKTNSFTATAVSLFLVAIGLMCVRRDLIRSSLYSGILTLLISIPFYIFVHNLDSGWALVTYQYEYLTGLTIYNFPIEEFIFWFLFGLAVGPMYEYMKGWSFK